MSAMPWQERLPALLLLAAAVLGRLPIVGGDAQRWTLHHARAGEGGSGARRRRSSHDFAGGTHCGVFGIDRWHETSCAKECPYKTLRDKAECRGKCVSASECTNVDTIRGFANSANMRCEGCRVPGCERCSVSADVCEKCSVGLRLNEGGTKCDLAGKPIFYAVLAVLVGALSFLVIWMLSLNCRQAVNSRVLESALEERELSKLRDESVPGMPLYPLSTMLTAEPISGRGVLLFFRHCLAVLLWAVLVTASLAIITSVYELQEAEERLNVCAMAQRRAQHGESPKETAKEDEVLFWFVFVVYVASTVGSLLLVVHQRTKFRELDSGTTAMQDFALIAKGFPRESDDAATPWERKPAEQEYREFIEGALGFRIVGVSVCWHYNGEQEAVDKAVARELAVLEWGEDFADRLKKEKSRPFLSSVDHALCGISADESDSEDEDSQEEILKGGGIAGMSLTSAKLARKFEASGYAIIVFHSKEDVERALRAFDRRSRKASGHRMDSREMDQLGSRTSRASASSSASASALSSAASLSRSSGPSTHDSRHHEHHHHDHNLEEHHHHHHGSVEAGPWPMLSSPTFVPHQHGSSRLRFRGKHAIQLHTLPCGPGEVCWENYGKHWAKVSRDVTIGIVKVALFVILWCVLFYGPYAYFVTVVTTVAGNASTLAGGTQGMLLGAVISVGNQLVYKVIRSMADQAGFHYSTAADNFNVSLYCVAVLINTILDLWTVVLLAHGERLDAAFQEQATGMTLESVAAMPSEEEALSSQLFAYLFPATLLGPFLAEGLIYFLTSQVTCLVIRTRSGVGPKHAQDMLILDRFEFSRYADNVINVMLVLIFLFFNSSRTIPAFLALVVALAYIFVWDSYRVLRGTQEHEMDLDTTENTAQFLLMMPCSLLAACAVYRGERLGWLGADSSRWYAVLAGLVHGLVHSGLIWAIQHAVSNSTDEELSQDETYKELAQEQALSWFNANPIHCLRSKYVLGESPPCVFCAKGKEKLLQVNEAAGCFFDGFALARTIDKAALARQEDFFSLGSSHTSPTTSRRSSDGAYSSARASRLSPQSGSRRLSPLRGGRPPRTTSRELQELLRK